MDWNEEIIYTTTKGIPPVEALLEENGIESYVLEDAEDFREFMKSTEIYWDYLDEELVKQKCSQETCFRFYLSGSVEDGKKLENVKKALESLKASDVEKRYGRLEIESAVTKQEDWEWGWKKYFKPFCVGDTFLIKPSWETVDDAGGRRILEIDPASSFGTGSHATTQLCITALEKEAKPGMRMLDMGTGSGILAIAASIIGAEVKAFVDIDANCIRAAKENAERNHVSIGEGYCGDVLLDTKLRNSIKGGYDIITANIVADVISSMSGLLYGWLSEGGVLVCSGILDEKAEDVLSSLEGSGLTLKERNSKEGWTAFTLVK